MADFDHSASTSHALVKFEAHFPLLERVVHQVMTGAIGTVRDLVYLAATVLLRAAEDYHESCGLSFKDYAEACITHALLHYLNHPVPVLVLPEALDPYQLRIGTVIRNLTSTHVQISGAALTASAYASPVGFSNFAIENQVSGTSHSPSKGSGLSWGAILKDSLPFVLALTCLTEATIAWQVLKSPRTWVAETTINTGIGSNDPINGKGDWFTQSTVVANITELIKSRTVLENTARALELKTPPEKLAEHLTVSRVGQAGLLKISSDADSPQGASELANATVREFLKYYASTQSQEARANRGFFESQVRSSRERLKQAESSLMAFKRERIPELEAAVPQRVNDLLAQRDQLRRELAGASSALSVAERELARVKADPLLSSKILNQAPVQTATEKLRDLEMNLMDARDVYGADAPIVKNLKDQIARQKSRLRLTQIESFEQNPALAETRGKVATLRADVARAQAQLAATERQLNQLSPRASQASTDQIRLEQLMREVKLADAQYTDLSNKFGQQSLLAQGAANLTMSVVDPALPPKEPLSNKLTLKLALGLVISAALGVFLAYLRRLMRRAPDAQSPTPVTTITLQRDAA